MGDYDEIFDQAENQEPLFGNQLPRLCAGTHRLAIRKFGGRNTRNTGVIMTAEFVVLQSNTLKPGDIRESSWFPQAPGDQSKYENTRMMEFLGVVGAGVNDKSAAKVVGGRIVDGTYCGAQVIAEVTPSLEKDGVTQKRSKKKNDLLFNVAWQPVPEQTFETVAAVRASIAQIQMTPQAVPVAAAPAAAVAPATTATPQSFGGFVQTAPMPAVAPLPPGFGPSPAPALSQGPGAGAVPAQAVGLQAILANLNPNRGG